MCACVCAYVCALLSMFNVHSQNIAVVTILQNDAAEGVFSISPTTAGPFIIDESTDDIIVIAIIREGGALTTETIFYNTVGGVTEIFGGQGFTTFIPGQRERTVNLLINNDNIPETNETYVFEITSSNSEILGTLRTVEVTILANDDFAGLFLLSADSLDQTLGNCGVCVCVCVGVLVCGLS